MGWETLVVWECELKNMDLVRSRLSEFLGAPRAPEKTKVPRGGS